MNCNDFSSVLNLKISLNSEKLRVILFLEEGSPNNAIMKSCKDVIVWFFSKINMYDSICIFICLVFNFMH